MIIKMADKLADKVGSIANEISLKKKQATKRELRVACILHTITALLYGELDEELTELAKTANCISKKCMDLHKRPVS